jgi:hypothetical protein
MIPHASPEERRILAGPRTLETACLYILGEMNWRKMRAGLNPACFTRAKELLEEGWPLRIVVHAVDELKRFPWFVHAGLVERAPWALIEEDWVRLMELAPWRDQPAKKQPKRRKELAHA